MGRHPGLVFDETWRVGSWEEQYVQGDPCAPAPYGRPRCPVQWRPLTWEGQPAAPGTRGQLIE